MVIIGRRGEGLIVQHEKCMAPPSLQPTPIQNTTTTKTQLNKEQIYKPKKFILNDKLMFQNKRFGNLPCFYGEASPSYVERQEGRCVL